MVVCCLDAFDPIPDEVETRPKVEAKPAPVVEKAPVQKLETKTAEESESESEDEESVADLEEILVSGKHEYLVRGEHYLVQWSGAKTHACTLLAFSDSSPGRGRWPEDRGAVSRWA
jgi:hypothetical protein